jgi:hypothetical protein
MDGAYSVPVNIGPASLSHGQFARLLLQLQAAFGGSLSSKLPSRLHQNTICGSLSAKCMWSAEGTVLCVGGATTQNQQQTLTQKSKPVLGLANSPENATFRAWPCPAQGCGSPLRHHARELGLDTLERTRANCATVRPRTEFPVRGLCDQNLSSSFSESLTSDSCVPHRYKLPRLTLYETPLYSISPKV